MNLNSTAKENKAARLTFSTTPSVSPSEIIIIGRKASLSTASIAATTSTTLFSNDDATTTTTTTAARPIIDAMLNDIQDSGGKATSFVPNASSTTTPSMTKVTIIVLPPPDKISRNNHPFSPHSISDSLVSHGLMNLHKSSSSTTTTTKRTVQIHVVDDRIEEHMCTAAVAIARTLPLYDSTSKPTFDPLVNVTFHDEKGDAVTSEDLHRTATAVAEGVRLSAKLGDMPPAELNPDAYAAMCRDVAESLSTSGGGGGANERNDVVTFREIVGEELREGGYGGIYGVGMAAACPPRMIVMTYVPRDDGGRKKVEHVALCGKGVIYDTGGLSLKPKVGMCGMKHDMGGSAGLLGTFLAAVRLRLPTKITLILAIVENAIGPTAVRNDDVLTMKSGKTVEINNTDAEGRLILADCVSHASNSVEGVDVILDMATLTGAVSVTTGKKHAGILARTRAMEERVYEAGLRTGDLAFPMLYAPELLRSEFASRVADMKNSVANRNNAQASCAGHFIESHIDEAYDGDWVHVDMAGPDSKDERATGYGVALVLGLLGAPGFC